jgi:antitoxin VapB
MSTAKVFRSGNSQAVRLPKEFRFKSKEVEIFRRGNELILREKSNEDVRQALELIAGLPEDVLLAAAEDDGPPQKRNNL